MEHYTLFSKPKEKWLEEQHCQDPQKVQLSSRRLVSLDLAHAHILLSKPDAVHGSGKPTITMGIQRESQTLRRNSEKSSKVSSFSALGAVNGFSWAEGSLWNSTANLRNQCLSTHHYLCNMKVRSLLLVGCLGSESRESIPISRSGENSRVLRGAGPGPWLPP